MKLTKLNQLPEDGRATKGTWEITPNHEVQYCAEGKDEEIKFKGSLIAAEPDALVISVTQRQSDQMTVTNNVKLAGTWKVNLKNQIAFEFHKESGKKDVLTYKAAWSVGDNHEILYTYTPTCSGGRPKAGLSLAEKNESRLSTQEPRHPAVKRAHKVKTDAIASVFSEA